MKTVEERFWEKVDIKGDEDCWEWTTSRQSPEKGKYGWFRFEKNKNMAKAHRVSWILANGSIPEGLEVCHSCDNPPCVNPKHLFLGTHTDNMKDMHTKGRRSYKHGDRHAQAILTNENVKWIKEQPKPKGRMGSKTYREWASMFGVTLSAIENIVYGKRWKSIK